MSITGGEKKSLPSDWRKKVRTKFKLLLWFYIITIVFACLVLIGLVIFKHVNEDERLLYIFLATILYIVIALFMILIQPQPETSVITNVGVKKSYSWLDKLRGKNNITVEYSKIFQGFWWKRGESKAKTGGIALHYSKKNGSGMLFLLEGVNIEKVEEAVEKLQSKGIKIIHTLGFPNIQKLKELIVKPR